MGIVVRCFRIFIYFVLDFLDIRLHFFPKERKANEWWKKPTYQAEDNTSTNKSTNSSRNSSYKVRQKHLPWWTNILHKFLKSWSFYCIDKTLEFKKLVLTERLCRCFLFDRKWSYLLFFCNWFFHIKNFLIIIQKKPPLANLFAKGSYFYIICSTQYLDTLQDLICPRSSVEEHGTPKAETQVRSLSGIPLSFFEAYKH